MNSKTIEQRKRDLLAVGFYPDWDDFKTPDMSLFAKPTYGLYGAEADAYFAPGGLSVESALAVFNPRCMYGNYTAVIKPLFTVDPKHRPRVRVLFSHGKPFYYFGDNVSGCPTKLLNQIKKQLR